MEQSVTGKDEKVKWKLDNIFDITLYSYIFNIIIQAWSCLSCISLPHLHMHYWIIVKQIKLMIWALNNYGCHSCWLFYVHFHTINKCSYFTKVFFCSVKLTVNYHWFRLWIAAKQMASYCFKSFTTERHDSNFTCAFSNSFYELICWAFPVKLVIGGCYRTLFITNQYWFR